MGAYTSAQKCVYPRRPFRLALRVLKIFELIQKSRRGQARKNVPRILKYCYLNFEIQDDCF